MRSRAPQGPRSPNYPIQSIHTPPEFTCDYFYRWWALTLDIQYHGRPVSHSEFGLFNHITSFGFWYDSGRHWRRKDNTFWLIFFNAHLHPLFKQPYDMCFVAKFRFSIRFDSYIWCRQRWKDWKLSAFFLFESRQLTGNKVWWGQGRSRFISPGCDKFGQRCHLFAFPALTRSRFTDCEARITPLYICFLCGREVSKVAKIETDRQKALVEMVERNGSSFAT